MIRLRFGRDRAPARHLDDATWQRLLQAYPFVRNLGEDRLPRLRDLCDRFLHLKRFAGEAGLQMTDDIGAAVALQACVPVIELGLDWYDDFEQIIVYPDQFGVPRQEIDEAGVVHEEHAWLAGESIDGGPVVLSWADIAPEASFDPRSPADDAPSIAVNVVIHEFVHKLDLRDGRSDGRPPLPAALRGRWTRELDRAYRDFVDRLEALERSLPRWLDPESEAADRWYARLPLDPYAAHDPAEFFAVSGEAFFLAPRTLAQAYPDYFTLLSEFFGLVPQEP